MSSTDVILEDINHKFDIMMEGLAMLKPMPERLGRLEETVDKLDVDMELVKATLRSHSTDLRDVRQSLGRLDIKISRHIEQTSR